MRTTPISRALLSILCACLAAPAFADETPTAPAPLPRAVVFDPRAQQARPELARGNAMVAGGIVALCVGVAAVGVGSVVGVVGYSLAEPARGGDHLTQARTNAAAGGTVAAIGLAGMVAGIPLIVIGRRHKRAALDRLALSAGGVSGTF